MAVGMTIDLSEFNAATEKALRMDDVRKKDIATIFRNANQPVLRTAKSLVNRSKFGSYSFKYPSRTHTAGALKRGVKFKASRQYKLVYYVLSKAWYSAIYATGHGTWKGNKFIATAWNIQENNVSRFIKEGLGALTVKDWQNG